MGDYGRAAVRAAAMFVEGLADTPQEAWSRSAQAEFKTSASRTKACPKGAFLGLCEEGLVKGIEPGRYTRSVDNKGYALQAVALLRQDGALVDKKEHLWARVGQGKAHNAQMDVVTALWANDRIVQ